MLRASVFIDGFNLYHAIMEEPAFRKYRWLNYRTLGESLLSKNQQLKDIFFFTAFYPNDPQKQARHQNFNLAQELVGVKIVLGAFRRKDKYCPSCRQTVRGFEEKQTDVNIAIELFRQAVLDTYDHALIVSGDSDLIPAVKAVKGLFPHKTIRVIIPPKKRANELQNAADSHETMKESHLANNQFPDPLVVSGRSLSKPPTWT